MKKQERCAMLAGELEKRTAENDLLVAALESGVSAIAPTSSVESLAHLAKPGVLMH